MCGDQGKTQDLHVPLLMRRGTMEAKGEDREENQHHEMRSTHPYPFQEVDAPKRETGLCSEGMDTSVYSCIQCTFYDDVSLHGDNVPRRPLDQ